MMWNALVSALLLRASIVMIDGNPGYPDLAPVAAGRGDAADDDGRQPGVRARLPEGRASSRGGATTSRRCGRSPSPARRCRSTASSGSTSSSDPSVLLINGSGGTDVCTGIVQGSPLLPVYAGEIAGRCLGVDAARSTPTATRSSASWASS